MANGPQFDNLFPPGATAKIHIRFLFFPRLIIMNGEGINYRLPEGAILDTQQCRAITKRRGLDRRCLHKTQRGIYCHQHLKVKRGLRITESETGEYGETSELGLFTTRAIKKNQIICDFTGKKVVGDFDKRFSIQIKKKPPTFLDASRTTENGEGRFAQDSDDPNAEIIYKKGDIGLLKALRPIQAGEEILVDKESYVVPAEKRKPIKQRVADAYEEEKQPEPAPWVPPPAPKTAVPRPAGPPRPIPRPAPRRPAAVPPPGQRQLTVKEKRFRLWILAMQTLYQDEVFAKEKKVRTKNFKIPVPAYDATKSVLYNEQTMQQAAWDAMKGFSKWLKVSEREAEEIVKNYIKRKRLQIGSGVPKNALIFQGALGQQHG